MNVQAKHPHSIFGFNIVPLSLIILISAEILSESIINNTAIVWEMAF